MNSKTSLSLVFAVFAVILFPFAILCHAHLFADGSYLFTRFLELKTMDAAAHTPARMGHHILTQAGAWMAMQCGVSSLRQLSWLYGIALFYLPWLAYLGAAGLFLRANRPQHALLVALMYCLLACFTAFFIISESHFSAALFVLSCAVIVTCDLARRPVQIALFLLWCLSLSCYEFWALYFPVCLGLLLWAPPPPSRTSARKYPLVLFALLYVLGAGLNVYSILFAPVAENRNAMFGNHFQSVWPQFMAVSILFLCALLFVASAVLLGKQTARVPPGLSACVAKSHHAASSPAFLVVLGLMAAAGVIAFTFFKVGDPKYCYALRSLNLVLPLLFAGYLWLTPTLLHSVDNPVFAPKGLIAGLFAVLCIASQALLCHSWGFAAFSHRVFAATRSHVGYVAIEDALPGNQRYATPWTYPTLSLLLQAMQPARVQSVLYNPTVLAQPFGPLDRDHARAFLSILAVPVEPDGLRVNPAAADPARKTAEPSH